MQSLFLGDHYGIGWQSQQHVLFNDTVVALQIPYPFEHSAIASQTISTAHHSGWISDIGLPSQRGVGYVYSNAHTTDEAAADELRRYLERTGGPRKLPSLQRITFNPGYREKFWHRNCVSSGPSAGFIEPLEASALLLVELSAAMLAEALPATRSAMDTFAARFNDASTHRWERVIDFLKIHYALSRRSDTDYWRDNVSPGSIPDRLRAQLELWRDQAPSRHDFEHVEEVFPSASHDYVLYGMGFRPAVNTRSPRRADDADRADHYFREVAALTSKMLARLPANRELIDHIKRSGLSGNKEGSSRLSGSGIRLG